MANPTDVIHTHPNERGVNEMEVIIPDELVEAAKESAEVAALIETIRAQQAVIEDEITEGFNKENRAVLKSRGVEIANANAAIEAFAAAVNREMFNAFYNLPETEGQRVGELIAQAPKGEPPVKPEVKEPVLTRLARRLLNEGPVKEHNDDLEKARKATEE